MLKPVIFRALTVQFLISVVLLFAPLAIFLGVFILQLKEGSYYAVLAMNIGGLEPIINSLSILYFVKPYRKFIKKKLVVFGIMEPVANIPSHQGHRTLSNAGFDADNNSVNAIRIR